MSASRLLDVHNAIAKNPKPQEVIVGTRTEDFVTVQITYAVSADDLAAVAEAFMKP